MLPEEESCGNDFQDGPSGKARSHSPWVGKFERTRAGWGGQGERSWVSLAWVVVGSGWRTVDRGGNFGARDCHHPNFDFDIDCGTEVGVDGIENGSAAVGKYGPGVANEAGPGAEVERESEGRLADEVGVELDWKNIENWMRSGVGCPVDERAFPRLLGVKKKGWSLLVQVQVIKNQEVEKGKEREKEKKNPI